MIDNKKAARSAKGTSRPRTGKRRGKKQRKRYDSIIRLTALMVSLLVIALVVVIVAPKRSHTVIINHPTQAKDIEIAAPPLEEDSQILRVETSYATDVEQTAEAPVQQTEPTVEPELTAEPVQAVNAQSADNAVQTQERDAQQTGFEYLPVFKQADIFEKKIAITVDDCFQVNNLQTIARTAYNNGGKLTLFPIGENFGKQGMADTIKTCVFKLGFEIENHTWSHERIFRLPEYEMAKQIWEQSQGLNLLLGYNYQQHFFRLMGGDGSSDQRTHNYLSQLGFKGIAWWSCSGSDADMNEIKENLKPGAIYLFHTTDGDTEKLKQFIPYAVSQGYQLVTLNELLGFEENAITQYSAQAMPIPQTYEEDYRTHKVGDYAWNIVLMQDKLRGMGLLDMEGPSTGYYGQKTAEAIQQYQQQQGLPATGVADSETQKRLLAA